MQAGGGGGGGRGGAQGLYRSIRSQQGPRTLGEINVTPLVDVVLVLLLVFVVTAPMMNKTIDVTLPQARLQQRENEVRLTVTVRANKQLFIDNKLVQDAYLEETLRDRVANATEKTVHLKADASLSYGHVIGIVDRIKRAGIEEVGFEYGQAGEAR